MKILLFLFLGFTAQGLYAQCDDSLAFSEADKESFVQVYLSVKKEKPKSQDQLLFELAAKHKITPQQYQEIQDPQIAKRALSPTEKEFVSDLQNMKADYKQQLREVEQKLCEDKSLSLSSYDDMKHQFRSCMRFQRSLSDYFENWMKK